jgi:hypothetical protein
MYHPDVGDNANVVTIQVVREAEPPGRKKWKPGIVSSHWCRLPVAVNEQAVENNDGWYGLPPYSWLTIPPCFFNIPTSRR